MRKKRKLKKQNPLGQLRPLEVGSRRFIVDRLNVVRGLERVLRRNEPLRRELDRLGGLNRALTTVGSPEEQSSLAQELSSYSNSLYLDRFFANDFSTVPQAQEMSTMGIDSNERIKTLSEELESCCETIQKMLRDLRKLVENGFQSTVDLLKSFHSETINNLSVLYNEIKNNFISTNELVEENFTNLITKLTDSFISLKTFIASNFRNFLNNLKSYINGEFRVLEVYINGEIVSLLGSISSVVAAELESFYDLKIQPNFLVLGTTLAGFGEILVKLLVDTKFISKEIKNVLSSLIDLKKHIDSGFENLKEFFQDILKEFKKELILEISEEVSNKIIGESYYRWNSTSSFYPTLVFKFKETNINKKARTTQLKLKLDLKSEELSDSYVSKLKKEEIKFI